MKTRISTIPAIGLIIYGAVVGCATATNAKVSRVDAEKTALAKAPRGIVNEAELEKELGRLVWSCNIETPGSTTITEIHVHANTGEIVATEHEDEESGAQGKSREKVTADFCFSS